MAEHIVIGIGLVGPFALPIEIPLGARLADHEPLPGLTLNPESDPFPVLIGVAIHVPPFECTGFTLPHARIGHDEDVVSEEFAFSLDLGVVGLLGPGSHELVEGFVFLGRKGWPLIDLDLVVLEVGQDQG